MAQIKYTVQLDLTDNGCINTGWRIKQGDYNNTVIVVKIVNNGVSVYDSQNMPSILFKRIDGKSVVGTMTTGANGTYQYSIIGSELAVPGIVVMDVKLTQDGRTSSASCTFECVNDTIGADTTPAGIYENSVTLAEIIEANVEGLEARDEAVEAAAEAKALVESGIATSTTVGLVKPDGVTTFVDGNGVLSSVGGGGGSTVTVNPIQTSGDKIAEITVNGAKSDIYSPSQVVQTWSTLTGKPFESIGANLSVDADGKLNATGGSGASTWNDITGKPFESLDPDTLEVENGVLKVIGGGGVVTSTIAVTTESDEFEGLTVTLSGAGITKTAVFSNKACSFTVTNIATYTVKVTYELEDYTNTVNVTTLGGYYQTELNYSAGSSYVGWLESANITDTFGSLESVLADQVTVRKLMTIHASADYLCEWVAEDDSVRATIFANAYAMKWIGLRDYVCDKLMAEYKAEMLESDNWEYILKDKVPVMTSNSAPYGIASASSERLNQAYYCFNGDSSTSFSYNNSANSFIKYKFTNPTCVNAMKYIIDSGQSTTDSFNLQVSNDDSTWETIATFTREDLTKTVFATNENYYLYVRILQTTKNSAFGGITWNTLQFYGRSLNVSVPTMTSNTSPYGEVIYSTYQSPYEAYKSFNTTYSESDSWYANTSTNEYLGYDFKKPVSVKYVDFIPMYPSSWGNCRVKNYKIQASNTGAWSGEEVTLISGTNTNSTSSQTDIIHQLDEADSYRYWRLLVLDTYNSSVVSLTKLQFFALDYSEREFAEGSNIKYIYDNGVELETLDNSGNVTVASGYTNDGGFTLNESSMSANVTTNHSRAIATNNTIDLSDFLNLMVNYNEINILSLDVSSINASKYIAMNIAKSSNTYFEITSFNSKSSPIYASGNNMGYSQSVNPTMPINIYSAWLE